MIIAGVVYLIASSIPQLIADDDDYDGCAVCGPKWSRPEAFESLSVLLHCILNVILARNMSEYNKWEDKCEKEIQNHEALVGVSELLCGAIGYWLRSSSAA